MNQQATMWSSRVEQELNCATLAKDKTARKAHLELAVLHFETEVKADGGKAREVITTALFSRLAFAAD